MRAILKAEESDHEVEEEYQELLEPPAHRLDSHKANVGCLNALRGYILDFEAACLESLKRSVSTNTMRGPCHRFKPHTQYSLCCAAWYHQDNAWADPADRAVWVDGVASARQPSSLRQRVLDFEAALYKKQADWRRAERRRKLAEAKATESKSKADGGAAASASASSSATTADGGGAAAGAAAGDSEGTPQPAASPSPSEDGDASDFDSDDEEPFVRQALAVDPDGKTLLYPVHKRRPAFLQVSQPTSSPAWPHEGVCCALKLN